MNAMKDLRKTKKQLVAELEIARSEIAKSKSNHRNTPAKLEELTQLRKAVQISGEIIFMTDADGIFTFVNPEFTKQYGYTSEEVIGKATPSILNGDWTQSEYKKFWSRLLKKKTIRQKIQNQRKDGSLVDIEATINAIHDANEIIGFIAIEREVTERKKVEDRLRHSEQQFRNLVETSQDLIWKLDSEGRFTYLNPAWENVLGYQIDEMIGRVFAEFKPPEIAERDLETFKKILGGTDTFGYETVYLSKSGEEKNMVFNAIYLKDASGEVIGTQGTAHDITERKRANNELKRMATHDLLTNLPNRALFDDRLSHAIDIAKRDKEILAVLFLDLDGFKTINDAFGHKQGDRLLQTIAERLLGNIRQSDTVARLGGDEFAILLEGPAHEREILPVVQNILEAVSEPFTIQEAEAFITGSIGISIFPTDGEDPEELIKNADQAMYQSKQIGKNNYSFFSADMKTQVLERLELRNQLRHGFEQGEFLLLYQPQIDSRSGKIIGVEALLRWQHPKHGIMLPDKFISVAEETGLIVPLGEWVLETACEQIKRWQEQGLPEVRLAVNLSKRELKRPDLVKVIKRILQSNELAPNLLELELTENIIFEDMETSLALLKALKGLGVRLAVDDFGTGYSTLSHLAQFPFDTLKIDQHFAPRLTTSPNDAAIVTGITTIAQNLGIEIIAEGVEDKQQLAQYEAMGCYLIQGWIFSRAVPAEEIEPLLRDGILRPKLNKIIDK